MELKEFIKETLSQIAAGIEAAQTEVRDCGGFVNPAHRATTKDSDKSHFGALESGQNIFLVDFDVAVTIVEGRGKEAKAKLSVASVLSVGGGGESNKSTSATNKISFKVPMALPVDSVTTEKLKEQDDLLKEKRRKQTEAVRNINRGRGSWMGA
jgi:hypothetical protein